MVYYELIIVTVLTNQTDTATKTDRVKYILQIFVEKVSIILVDSVYLQLLSNSFSILGVKAAVQAP